MTVERLAYSSRIVQCHPRISSVQNTVFQTWKAMKVVDPSQSSFLYSRYHIHIMVYDIIWIYHISWIIIHCNLSKRSSKTFRPPLTTKVAANLALVLQRQRCSRRPGPCEALRPGMTLLQRRCRVQAPISWRLCVEFVFQRPYGFYWDHRDPCLTSAKTCENLVTNISWKYCACLLSML